MSGVNVTRGGGSEPSPGPRPLAVQLYTFRRELTVDAEAVFRRIADMGYTGVEPVSPLALPPQLRREAAGWALDAPELKRLLDDSGLVVCSAHTTLPESADESAVFREQELLGNDVLIVSSPGVLLGGADTDLAARDSLLRLAERFNAAAQRAATRGMRVGYHNHWWEWSARIDGRPGYDAFWDHLDPSVIAEVDLYWAQVAGQDPSAVIARLGPRAQLVHVKDGPLERDEPMSAVGAGRADIATPLAAGRYLSWYIVELDESETDVFDAVAESARWLIDRGLGARSPGVRA